MDARPMTDVERLLVAQALYAKLGPTVSTKGDGLRAQLDAHYKELWESNDTTQFALRFGGEKVATYSISETKPKRGEDEVVFDLVDNDAYDEWMCTEDAIEQALSFADAHGTEFARHVLQSTGEVPPGVEARVVHSPDDPGGTYRCGMIKNLDADRVLTLAASMNLPTQNIVGLLAE